MIGSRVPAPGVVLAVAAVLAGCAQDEPTSAPGPGTPSESVQNGTPSSAAPARPTPTVRTLEITVTGTTVEPAPAQVDLAVGETLRLVITADGGSAVHAHGFDGTEVPITPGEPATVELTGDEPGVYEIELHDPDLLLLRVAVR